MALEFVKPFLKKMGRTYLAAMDQSFEYNFLDFGFYPLLGLFWALVSQCSTMALDFPALFDPEMKYFWSALLHTMLYSSIIFAMVQLDNEMWTTKETVILNVKIAMDLAVNLAYACVVGMGLGCLHVTFDIVPWSFTGIVAIWVSFTFVILFTRLYLIFPCYGVNVAHKMTFEAMKTE